MSARKLTMFGLVYCMWTEE